MSLTDNDESVLPTQENVWTDQTCSTKSLYQTVTPAKPLRNGRWTTSWLYEGKPSEYITHPHILKVYRADDVLVELASSFEEPAPVLHVFKCRGPALGNMCLCLRARSNWSVSLCFFKTTPALINHFKSSSRDNSRSSLNSLTADWCEYFHSSAE